MKEGHKETVRHDGVVESIEGSKCRVRILQSSACSGCAAHNLCSSSESKEKMVDAYMGKDIVNIGDTVVVEGTVRQGLKAVYVGYLIPLVLVVVLLTVGIKLIGEGAGILFVFMGLLMYYSGLYMFRDKVGKQFCFVIKSKQNI